jgi:short subunit dehydrogenase-like uncharacterized protein
LGLLASELGLPSRRAALDAPAALDAALAGVAVLLNAAGPFSATWSPLVEACLRSRVHYLDLTGEVAVFEGIRLRGADARARGIVLLPGVGFDVVPSDCLAAHVSMQLPRARLLRIGISGLGLVSRGSARTIAEQMGRPLVVRRDGVLRTLPPGSLERAFDYGSGPSASVAVSWGDIATAFDTTGIPDIETYFEATPFVRAAATASRWAGPLLSTPTWRALMDAAASSLPPGPDSGVRAARGAAIVAEATDGEGRTVRARLRTAEAYTLSAETAAAAAADVLRGEFDPGYQTPGRLFGPDYVLRFGGVVRESLPNCVRVRKESTCVGQDQ